MVEKGEQNRSVYSAEPDLTRSVRGGVCALTDFCSPRCLSRHMRTVAH
jgi:hypothetical protein